MRILIIVTSNYPHIGGVDYVVKSTAERPVKKRHNVTVIASNPARKTPQREVINGVKVVRRPTLAPNGAYHLPRRRNQLRNLLQGLLRDVDAAHDHSAHAILTV
jgi:glycosyltransferase involved in cell wall biosynthesis